MDGLASQKGHTDQMTVTAAKSPRRCFPHMKKFKPYLVIAAVAAITIAVIFRVGKVRSVVIGQ